MKSITYILSFICLFFHLDGFTQPENKQIQNVVMPPPNAASLGKYGDIPVNLATGTPSIGVPIYTVTDGKISLPISVNYHAGGYKVGEVASWVGQGWSLDAGGMISRTVLGLPDESLNGYWFEGSNLDQTALTTTTQGFTDLCEIANGELDGEPDLFSLNLPGFSTKFVIDKDHDVQIIAQHIDLKIKYDFNSSQGGFKSFTVTTPNGNKYYFGEVGLTTAYEYLTVNNNSSDRYISSWMLLKIESFDQVNDIILTYTPETYSYKSLASCSNGMGNIGPLGENCPGAMGPDVVTVNGSTYNVEYIQQRLEGQRLNQITSNTQTVTFEVASTFREDIPNISSEGSKSLDAIKIETGTTLSFCTRFEFSYDYFRDQDYSANSNLKYFSRLQLQEIHKVACDGSDEEEPYKFTYSGTTNPDGSIYLPHRLTKAIDHWGYYNGEENNNDLRVIVPNTTVTNPRTLAPINYGAALRESDSTSLLLGMLNKMEYPTGGHTEFKYSANQVEQILSTTNNYLIEDLETPCSIGNPPPTHFPVAMRRMKMLSKLSLSLPLKDQKMPFLIYPTKVTQAVVILTTLLW